MNENNWTSKPTSTVTDADKKALAVAKKIENKKVKDGWRYHKLNERVSVLVPYGKNGKPTKVGLRLIEAQKEAYGIK